MHAPTLLQFREATTRDLPAIVAMLADDVLGATRERFEDPLPDAYRRAFDAIQSSPSNQLIVGTLDGEVVATLQLTFIPGLSHRGATRALVEAVRVASGHRGAGIGEALMREAMTRAKEAGCSVVQLTTNVQRTDAKRFYERLGFEASHVGMKYTL